MTNEEFHEALYRERCRREVAETEARALRQRVAAYEKECLEEARLNGMGSEREARLMARVSELEAVIKSHGIPVKTATGGEAHYCTVAETLQSDGWKDASGTGELWWKKPK